MEYAGSLRVILSAQELAHIERHKKLCLESGELPLLDYRLVSIVRPADPFAGRGGLYMVMTDNFTYDALAL